MNPSVLVVANWRDVAHSEAGGAEQCCEQLATRLAKLGHEVVFLTSRERGMPKVEHRDGITLVRGGGRFTVYLYGLAWLLFNRRRIEGVIDSQNGIPFFSPLALRRTTPVVLLLHHIHQEQFAKYFPAPVAALGRWLEGPASRRVYANRSVIAVSPSTMLGGRTQLGLRGRFYVVPPGWLMGEPPERRRSPSPKIVCVSRLVPHKRVDLVVRALPEVLREYPDLRLEIVGGGPGQPALEELARQLGVDDSVNFIGPVPAAERDERLATAWITVNSSQGEGWALTVIEANVLGVPVVGMDVPGLRDSIRNGETGWLVDEPSHIGRDIVEALRAVATPDNAASWERRTRDWVQRFDWQFSAEGADAVLNEEAHRLRWGSNDRRRRVDEGTIVELPTHQKDVEAFLGSLRATDRAHCDAQGTAILLPLTGTAGALRVLERLGELVNGSATVIRAAEATDHVAPAVRGSEAVAKLPGPADD
jgi:glycosyltransferase involved in cell wall biosynthesis